MRSLPASCRTPAASILVRRLGLDLAVVVSASHNPWQDNGIKFFGRDGAKLSDEAEDRVEAAVHADLRPPRPSARSGSFTARRGKDYLREYEGAFRNRLDGLKVVLDCANGSTHLTGPEIFKRLGAEVDVLFAEPDGRNVEQVGWTPIPKLLSSGSRPPEPTSASPSTATAIGFSPSTPRGRCATGTS